MATIYGYDVILGGGAAGPASGEGLRRRLFTQRSAVTRAARLLRVVVLLLVPGAFALAGCGPSSRRGALSPPAMTPASAPLAMPPAAALTPFQAKVIARAKSQIGDAYDASYRVLPYPNGDPPTGEGACTDVVIRSLRAGGCDLQTLVHQDMAAHWEDYPHKWGLHRPDRNIDHRRVPNLARFFTRHGQVLTKTVSPRTLAEWQPGDIVCWQTPLDHTGIVSDRRDPQGIPYVIHNLDRCAEQDVLTQWPITGHYRYPPRRSRSGGQAAVARRAAATAAS